MSAGFQLHPQLAADTALVTELKTCRCLLMNDVRFAWLILVPRINNLRELHEVPDAQRMALFDDISTASQALENVTNAHKLNVAALGNQVPQLHIHVIARQLDDPAWPAPVWGMGTATAYAAETQLALITALNKQIQG